MEVTPLQNLLESQLNSTNQSNQGSQVTGQFATILSQVKELHGPTHQARLTDEEGDDVQEELLAAVENEQETLTSALPVLEKDTKAKAQNITVTPSVISLAADNQATISPGFETNLVIVAEQSQTSDLAEAETKQNSIPIIQPSSTEIKPLASFVQGEVSLETNTSFKLGGEQVESVTTNSTAENKKSTSSVVENLLSISPDAKPISQAGLSRETSTPFKLEGKQIESLTTNVTTENKNLTSNVAEHSSVSSLEGRPTSQGEHPLETKPPLKFGAEQLEPGTTDVTAENKNSQLLGNISNQVETEVKPQTNEKNTLNTVEVINQQETKTDGTFVEGTPKARELVADVLAQNLSKLKAKTAEQPTNLSGGDGGFQTVTQTPQLNGQLGTSPGGKVNELPNFLPPENLTKLTTIFNEIELKNGDVKTMKIQLEPSSLGEVEIVLEQVGSEVKTKILVGNQQLKELFEKSLPLLELTNQKQVVNLSNIKVGVQQDPTSFANFNHQFQNSPQQHSSQRGKSQKGTNQYRSQPIEEREDTGMLANEGVDLLV